MEITIKKENNKLIIKKDSQEDYKKKHKKDMRDMIIGMFFSACFIALTVYNIVYHRDILDRMIFFIVFTLVLPFAMAKIVQILHHERYKLCDEILEMDNHEIVVSHMLKEKETYSKTIKTEKITKIIYESKEESKSKTWLGKNTIMTIFDGKKYSDATFDFKRGLKICTDDDTIAWGYDVKEEKIKEIIREIKSFLQIPSKK